MFSSRIGWKPTAQLCRSLATMLHSGVDVRKAFELTASKASDAKARDALAKVTLEIRKGEDVSSAMRAQEDRFPDLLIDMVAVAEASGSLPEILLGLADHYENNLRLRRNFLAAIAWPVFQLVAAILVIAGVIFLLGMIADSRGATVDLLGLGTGPGAAALWLACTFGTFFGLAGVYLLATRAMQGKELVHRWIMQIPVVGKCMQSFAIARFSWAYYLTQQTGMPVDHALKASLRATANGAFIGRTKLITDLVRSGEPLSHALETSELFPDDFIHMVEVAETSGTVPEALNRLSPQFEEQARRSLAALTAVIAWLVWLTVAVFIVYIIFRIVLNYVGLLDSLIEETY